MRDLKDDGWLDELPGNYDVVATVNVDVLLKDADQVVIGALKSVS